MNYSQLLGPDARFGETKETIFEEENPSIKEIQIPSLLDMLKQDVLFHLLAGAIFGAGHFLGLRLMKSAFD